MKKNTINLDIEMLRGVAIVMVLFQHYPSLYFWSDHSFFKLVSQYCTFWTGVDLFFCISGFVVGKSLINKLDDKIKKPKERNEVIKDFFIKRAFRLLPTSIFWVVIVLLLSKYFNNSGAFGIFHENLKQALSVLTYNYNWYVVKVNQAGIPPTLAPYWSLNLEEQFYFIFPLFLIVIPKKYRVTILLAASAVLFFIKRQGFMSFNFRIDAISYGVVLAIISSNQGYDKLKNIVHSKIFSPFLITIFCVALLIFIPEAMWNSSLMIGVIALVSFFMIYMASFGNGEISLPQPIKNAMIYIGNRSYGIYIIHIPAIYISQELFARNFASKGVAPYASLTNDLSITVISLIITWVLVEINFRLIETPTRKLGAFIVARRSNEWTEMRSKSA